MTKLKTSIYVGIDIAKEFHEICVIDDNGTIITKFQITATLAGFEKILCELDGYESIVFGMEKTGVYSANLDTFLLEQYNSDKFQNINTEIILTHSFAVARLRDVYSASKKTDPFDAYIIAEGLRMGVLKDCRKDKKFSKLKSILERRDNLINRQTSVISQLRNQLVMAFPDFEQEFDRINTNTALAILDICPTSERFDKTRVSEIYKHIRANRGRISKERLNRLYEKNRTSVASNSDELAEFMIQNLATELKGIKSLLKATEKAIDLFSSQFEEQIELLRSVPGFGKWMPYYFLSVIGNHERFMQENGSGAKHFASYLGLDLREHSSGNKKFVGSISKRGDARLRGKMYMAAINAIRVDKDIKSKYNSLQERNGSKIKSVVAIMRLLARRCFGVLKSGIPYNNNIPKFANGPLEEGPPSFNVVST